MPYKFNIFTGTFDIVSPAVATILARLTQSGDNRITMAGDYRITQDQ